MKAPRHKCLIDSLKRCSARSRRRPFVMLTNPLPDIGADGSSAERCGEGFAFVADGEVLRCVAGVSDDENGFT